MEIGGANMEGPRAFSQESSTRAAGGPAATSANSCINLPLDNGRPVAVETTPNPLAYWPPPASALPLINSSKDEASLRDAADSSESSNVGRKVGTQAAEEGTPESRSLDAAALSSTSPRILHHNLPPIAGITSSHNYRGTREVQRYSLVNSVDETKSAPEKFADGRVVIDGDEKKNGANVEDGHKKIEAKTDCEKTGSEPADCEILEVPPASCSERPKTANSDHVFSIPSAINSTTHPKTLPSPRAPTPFFSCPVSASVSLPVAVSNSSSSLPATSSARALPPNFTVPSPTPGACTSVRPASPSEGPRPFPSPHSNLSSPSGVHRALSSPHPRMSSAGDAPQRLASPHPASPRGNASSPCQRPGNASPFVANSHANLPTYGERIFRDSAHQSQISRTNVQIGLPSTTSDLPQRINQPVDGQTCRNPFELPMSKSYQQDQYHPSNVRHPSDSHLKFEQYLNLPASVRDQHGRSGGGLFPSGFKPTAAKIIEKDCERQGDLKHKPLANSQSLQATRGTYAVDSSQGHAAVQRPPNPMRSEGQHRDFSEMLGCKSQSATVASWSKPETNEIAYVNAQNACKGFVKVNGNEYSQSGYHNPLKQGVHHSSEAFSRLSGSNGEKQNGGFNQVTPLSQRFPPVPQSNYDLNRHIYDSMTAASRPPQTQIMRPPEKNSLQFPSRDSSLSNLQQSKTQSNYRDISEAEKGKNFVPSVPAKGSEYSGRLTHDPFAQYNNVADKLGQDGYQNKRSGCGQSPFSCQGQSNEARNPLAGPPPPAQGFSSRMNAGHSLVQPSGSTPASDKSSALQSRVVFPQKHRQNLSDYEGKKMAEAKSMGGPQQFSGTQNAHQLGSPLQPKNRTPSSTAVPVRSKRESPLDLSVKTVRQSADSTAKDDGEIYLQNFRNFLHGSNQAPRTEVRYPVCHSNGGATGAPKIDFTPNFSEFHTESQNPNISPHHKSETSALPPVESFKKFSGKLPVSVVQDHKIRPSFNSNKYFGPSGNSDPPSARYPDHFKIETQKRPADDPATTQSPLSKIPKIDPWKLAFDQQIEQRLNSARISHQNSQSAERAVNGLDGFKSGPAGSLYPSNYQRHSGNHAYPKPPVQTSAAPYNPSFVQQPQCQTATPQTPQEKPQHREHVGNSPDPEQIIKQISKGVMPDHKLLQDKNVLSILRSSLEEKEAKLMQLREVAKRKEKYKELMTSDPSRKQFQTFEQTPNSQPYGKSGLPPFGALALERMCAPPSFPGHRLHLSRPVDTVKIDVEPSQKYLGQPTKSEPEKSGIPSADLSPNDDAQGPPTDFDGLAAFLAARIRTKGELKQVGPSLSPGRPILHLHKPHVSINDTTEKGIHQATSLPGTNIPSSGSPPKLIRESRLLPPLRRRLFSHTEEEMPTTSAAQPEDNQPIPARDPNGIRSSSETSVFDFRESDSEGEMPVLERQTLEGMRRDRKTFGSKQNVSTTTPDDAVEMDKPEVIAELDKSHPDPFWDTAFDMFVEQLQKRPPKRSVRKKRIFGRLPLEEAEQSEKSNGGETGENSKGAELAKDAVTEINDNDTNFNFSLNVIKSETETESEESKTVGNVPDRHLKLSSTRLKVYRDEVLKEEEISRDVKMKEEYEEKDEEEEDEDEEEVEEEEEEEEKERQGQRQKQREREREGESEKEKEQKNKEREKVGKVEKVEKMTKEPGKSRKGGEVREGCGVRTRGKAKAKTKAKAKAKAKGEAEVDEKGSVVVGYESDSEGRDVRSESESTQEDDDDSLSLSGLESESSDSDSSPESSNSNFSSYEDSENEATAKKRMRMQTRLQTRSSRQRQVKGTGMKLRSKTAPLPQAAAKLTKKRKKRKEEYYSSGKKKKPSFGDGSDFRPGWEEECYKFKQQLRMPEKLISISRPPKRSSASLPDLDPYRNSPSLDSSDATVTRKSESRKAEAESDESDADPSKKFKGEEGSVWPSDNGLSLLKSRNGKKSQSSSIINLLVNKYGKGNLKKQKELKAMNERKSPRILPKATNKPELLPTPGLGIGKENVLKDKKRTKEAGKKKAEDGESMYLGYFRRKTVNNFKEAFKQKMGILPQEFSPVVLKSRTRTQTRDMKKRATLMEVFGEDRPASAPPLCREEDASTDQEKGEKAPEKRKPKVVKKVCGGVVTRGRGKLTRSGRPGLRSTAVLRSNKAVQNSKRHLNAGRKRNMDLLKIRALASKKFSYLVNSSDGPGQLPITKKRLKLRSVRRKFRSGFDYIRKKKKMKKDGDSADGSVKEKRLPPRPTSESVEDIQNEMKNWVINKGLGETILHRAARLGYTDVAAYCLEKMDCSPSPRDNAGYTPLHEACSRGHLDIAKLLLMYGASVSESAKGGIRPLHEAAENGFTELIRLLLSYGADPLLETYTGHTALSLVSDEEARRLIQHHLADVQGNVAPAWTFRGPSSLFDPAETGYDPLCDPPSPPSVHSDCELEASEAMLPPVYRLAGDRDPERRWLLMRDVLVHTKVKSKDALLKHFSPTSLREMKLSEFHEQARSCSFLGLGDRPPTKASKIILVPYDDKARQLLGVERISP